MNLEIIKEKFSSYGLETVDFEVEVCGDRDSVLEYILKKVRLNDDGLRNLKFVNKKILLISESSDLLFDISKYDYVLVVAKDGVELDLNFLSDKSWNVLMELYVEDKSSLKINMVSQVSCEGLVLRSFVESNSKLEVNFADMVGVNAYLEKVESRFDVKNFLVGENAEGNVNWIYASDDHCVSKNWVRNYYQARNCRGKIMVKGIQSGRSVVDFLGEINISLNGGGTDSYLKQDILLLDDSSRVNAIPSLEIKTNDVKAGHGVSVSKLTGDKLFYLMSRGVSDVQAKKLLKNGFLMSLSNSFSQPARLVLMDLIEKYE